MKNLCLKSQAELRAEKARLAALPPSKTRDEHYRAVVAELNNRFSILPSFYERPLSSGMTEKVPAFHCTEA